MKMKIKGSGLTDGNPEENSSWERNMLEKLLFEVYREQRRNRIWRWFWRLFWIFIIVVVITSLGSTKPGGAHTAVIDLDGIISSDNNQADLLRKSLKEAYKNSNVKGIIIRANSPGGSPVISSIAYEEIRYLKAKHPRIPLYIVTEDMCASGCYYIASAADKIYADPSSLVGSIGVIGSSFDFTGLIDKLGIKRRVKIAGSNKDMGDPFVPETPEQAEIWQQMLSSIHKQFIQAVQQGRGNRLKIADNPDIFSGRAYTGEEAKAVGLIDDFGNVYTVARDVIGAPELVDYTSETGWGSRLGKGISSTLQQNIQGMANKPW
ncbi:S49 family peptidase [Snodgrassella sp. ESL0253]|uniref:S49 family peptidase n=1 Tax=Snodgrassella sp. ESL0253 TaxID=2705031 RepID=UPI001581891D|nr:S49 family peptidase [Snodgrassella sp. ESL0253]NUE66524.1 S49 family peptidase [Snodgrassella sp. ESL0253]